MANFGSGGSGDEQREFNNSHSKGKKNCVRHTTIQIHLLEAFFKDCPHPNDDQRKQLSRELGLDLKQIKFWFQNKRTQTKAQIDRADNSVLRAENEKISCENYALKEALNNVICPACGGPPFGQEERNRSLERLRMENTKLKLEHEKLSNIVAKYSGKPLPQIESLMDMRTLSLDTRENRGGIGSRDRGDGNSTLSKEPNPKVRPEVEKAVMLETAAAALEELYKLLRINEPLWTKSSIDGRYFLQRDSYEKIFLRPGHFKSSTVHFESSKYAGLVAMKSTDLVDAFLDSEKWADLFQTIVTQARTVQVIETRIGGNRSGSFQLMYEQMHVLSPLVAPRQFWFLRCCQQIEAGLWVIADVSYDSRNYQKAPTSHSWRLPSGCMIQDLPNGCSKVTWVEHVEADDKTRTHRLYRGILCSGSAYGAERWVASLERMCERLTYSMANVEAISSSRDRDGVMRISRPEGRKSVMNLARRMVKDFCVALSMSSEADFRQHSKVNNTNCGIRVSVRQSRGPGEPTGTIVTAATSLWLPISPQDLFNFLRDENMRIQWDVLANGSPVYEVARISYGPHPGNSISIMQPGIPVESMLLLQESRTDNTGSLIVYAPTDMPTINSAFNGEETSQIPLLPLGFTICGSDHATSNAVGLPVPATPTATDAASGGSLLTAAFQMLVSGPSSETAQPNLDCIATVNALINTTLEKIKAALNCSAS